MTGTNLQLFGVAYGYEVAVFKPPTMIPGLLSLSSEVVATLWVLAVTAPSPGFNHMVYHIPRARRWLGTSVF